MGRNIGRGYFKDWKAKIPTMLWGGGYQEVVGNELKSEEYLKKKETIKVEVINILEGVFHVNIREGSSRNV